MVRFDMCFDNYYDVGDYDEYGAILMLEDFGW
jgi:hypothetical protein